VGTGPSRVTLTSTSIHAVRWTAIFFGLGARGFSSIRSRSKCINLLVPVAWVTSNEWYPEGQQSGARLTERGKFVT
jgi:hypothetical protein